jgi:NAD(P)-dependent dehydrogenase (short-subunit alcohol dehydrogenase family)
LPAGLESVPAIFHAPAMNAKPQPTALITGAARRIGRAIALDLAAAGWRVVVHYNGSAADAAAVVREIEQAGGRAVAVQADLMDEAAAEALMEKAAKATGPVTCLINNASVFERDDPKTATKETWDAHMQVNLRAPFVLTQAFARRLPAGAEGDVINLIDQRVWNVTPHFTSYTVSKVALWGLTQNLALALAPQIRVNAIGPGPILQSRHQSAEQFRRQWSRLPLGRQVMPAEICRAVRFLLDAPSMTGQMIMLDGGQHLGWAPGPAGRDTAE